MRVGHDMSWSRGILGSVLACVLAGIQYGWINGALVAVALMVLMPIHPKRVN